MSDEYFKSESYIRGANNDGMDPNWKPIPQDNRPKSIKDFENLFYAAKKVADVFKKDNAVDVNSDSATAVTMHNKFWRELIESVEVLK